MLTSTFVPSLDPLVVACSDVVCDSVVAAVVASVVAAVGVLVVGVVVAFVVSSNATGGGRKEDPGTNDVAGVVHNNSVNHFV